MNDASGENAPTVNISRSHTDRSDSCKDCNSIACAFTFSTSSGGTIRSTRLPPYGVIRCDTVFNLLFLRFQTGPQHGPARASLSGKSQFLRLLVGLVEASPQELVIRLG